MVVFFRERKKSEAFIQAFWSPKYETGEAMQPEVGAIMSSSSSSTRVVLFFFECEA